jgi:hypothetical protein
MGELKLLEAIVDRLNKAKILRKYLGTSPNAADPSVLLLSLWSTRCTPKSRALNADHRSIQAHTAV